MAKLTSGLRMVKIFKLIFHKNAGLYTYGPVFFLMLILACGHHSKNITVVWKDQDAIGISIPEELADHSSAALTNGSLIVSVRGTTRPTAILGGYTKTHHSVIFEPAVPLTPGLVYVVIQSGKQLGTVQVPFAKNEEPPKVTNIYPLADTLPENLLKLYIGFSKPMHRGQVLDYVKLLDNRGDTMRNVFLDLQPELWDTTGRVLTLWLDPGRIKRGLVLNKKLGNPLKRAQAYKLVILMDWKDNRGMKLGKYYSKQFLAGGRQEKAPDTGNWQIGLPKAGSVQPLNIRFPTPMDHYLLLESIQVFDDKGKLVQGHITTSGNDRIWQFVPQSAWQAQNYSLKVAGRLEDLAGNNLNRVFDRDITKDKQQRNEHFYNKVFRILP